MHHKRMKFHMMRGFKRSNAFIWTLPSALYFSSSVFWFGFFPLLWCSFSHFSHERMYTRLLAQFHRCQNDLVHVTGVNRVTSKYWILYGVLYLAYTIHSYVVCDCKNWRCNSKNIKENENEPFLPWFCNSFRFLHHGIIIWAVSTVNASN